MSTAETGGLPRLIVATSNPGKAKEIRAMLEGFVEVETLADHPDLVMPPESADTFAGNACIKAEFVSKTLDVAALADDSGLVVDALDGAPGVRSARYAEGSDEDRYRKLLAALSDVADEERTARFACAMAFAVPGEETLVEHGYCEGRIERAPRGDGGFGYDPIFGVADDTRTMAELSRDDKSAISHRGHALAAMRPALERHFSLEVAPRNP